MNLLSQRARLGILVVLDIALAKEEPLASKVFAARHKLPPRHLESMLQALVHGGILSAVRGPSGGYRLGREGRRITLGKIARLVQSLSTVDPESYSVGSALFKRVIEPRLQEASRPFVVNLDAITIADLCERAERLGQTSYDDDMSPAAMTLDAMRAQGVRSVTTRCANCGYESDFLVDPLDGDVRVADLGRRMRCVACGGRKIDTRPAAPESHKRAAKP